MRQDAKASSFAGMEGSASRGGPPGVGGGVRGAPSEGGDGGGDRPFPLRLLPHLPRPGHDPGGMAAVADPALRDGPVRRVEHPGHVGGETPVAALEGDLDPAPEILRRPASPLRPDRERAVAGIGLGARDAPELRGGLESGRVVPRLEQRPRVQAPAPRVAKGGRERRVHLEEKFPAELAREAVEPEPPHRVGHRGIGNGREKRLDRPVVVPAEPAAELEGTQPGVEGMVPEHVRQAVEAGPLAASAARPGPRGPGCGRRLPGRPAAPPNRPALRRDAAAGASAPRRRKIASPRTPGAPKEPVRTRCGFGRRSSGRSLPPHPAPAGGGAPFQPRRRDPARRRKTWNACSD